MTDSHPADIPWPEGAAIDDVKRVVEAVYRVHRFLLAITDLTRLLEQITEEARQVASAEAGSVMLYDSDSAELYFLVALGQSGDQESLKREVRLKLGQGIAGATAASRSSIRVEDAQADPRFYREADAASDFQTRNLLAVPMIDRGNLIGVLEVVNKIGAPAFNDLDVRVLEILASLAATAIVNARLIEEQIHNAQLAAIGQAVTSLSHHTKNIVTGLSSSADLIEMGLAQNNVDVLKRSFPVFKRSTKRISNFVQDMLSFSKPRKPVRERCFLADIVRETQETFAELLSQKNTALHVDLSRAEGPLFVDPQAMYRAMLNLLTNAADAVPRDGGEIWIDARTMDGNRVEITIRDNGPGVPDHLRNRIFDPFFSTKGAHGTGIGLAVTRKSILEHGGEISVENHPEGGACFRIVLPAAPE